MAIALLILFKILLGYFALVLGFSAAWNGFILPAWFQWPLAAVAVAGLAVYPIRSMKARLGKQSFYRRQKRADALLVAIGFAGIFFAGNLIQACTPHTPLATTALAPASFAMACVRGAPGGWASVERQTGLVHVLQGKIKSRLTHKFLKWEQKIQRMNTAGRIALSVLVVLLALLLAYVIAAISCNLSCSGNETLAIVVAVGGAAGIVVGAVFAFRSIWKKPGEGNK